MGMMINSHRFGVPATPTPLDISGWSALYLPDAPGNSVSQWTDQSGNALHATQATGANQYVLNTNGGINGKSSYVNATFDALPFWNLPGGLSVDRRSHSWYFIGRSRSMRGVASRCPVSFNSGLTDLMTEFTDAVGNTPLRFRTFGTSAQTAAIWGRSSLTVIILTATASGVNIRINAETASLSAYSSGTTTGGYLGKRQDGYNWSGEIYEFGVMPRELDSSEITLLENYAASFYGRPLSAENEIAIVGDSLTEGRHATNQKGWPWLLDNSLGATWQQLSQGRDGAYIGVGANNMLDESSGLANTFRAGKTKHVAIMAGGTNDLGIGAQTAATVLGYIQTWCTTMKAAGWSTIVCTIAKRDDTDWSAGKETHRQNLNTSILALSNTYADAIFDLAGLSELSDPTDGTYFSTDKLHWKDPVFVAVEAGLRPVVLSL